MPTDRELIDALCRTTGGWTPDIPGDKEDFVAAHKLIDSHRETLRGTFAPTVEMRLRTALTDLVGGMKSLKLDGNLPGPVARAAALLAKLSE